MTPTDSSTSGAPGGAPLVKPFPSQVQDGWVRAEHLEAALREHLGAEVAAPLLHQVQAQIGRGALPMRWAHDGQALDPTSGFFRPRNQMRLDGGPLPDGPRLPPMEMDWTHGHACMRCSRIVKRVNAAGALTRDAEEHLVPIGAVEIFWLDVVALLPSAAERSPAAEGNNVPAARNLFLPTQRAEKAKSELNDDRRLLEKIESGMRKHVAEQLAAEPNSKPPTKRWLIRKTMTSTGCTQDQAEVVYGTLPGTMKLRHGGQKSKRAKNAGG
jgi:hypothetical protein